jgi:hypothetical protein
VVSPSVDLSELQRVVGDYAGQHQLISAAGPFTAATLLRTFVFKNKLASTAVVAGGVWMTIHLLSDSTLRLIQEQFGYLEQLFGR